MSTNAVPRKRNLFDPTSEKPYRISRSKIDLFMSCPRCFYLDRRRGVSRPADFPLTLNNVLDHLMKAEFDWYRLVQLPHPVMTKYAVNAVPYAHPDLEVWRDGLRRGITRLHEPTNFLVTGGLDDVWVKPNKCLFVVDYKGTWKKDGIVTLDAPWQISYKRQVEVYQWLLRGQGFEVSDAAFFVYANCDTSENIFGGKLKFNLSIVTHYGSDAWVDDALVSIKSCLMEDELPAASSECAWCNYRSLRHMIECK